MTMKNYELIVFDMDGTILDTLTDITNSLNYVMREFGLKEHTYGQVRGYVGSGARVLFERALSNNKDEALIDKCVGLFREYYHDHCKEKTAPYVGIIELLQTLKDKGYKLAVVSNKPNDAVQVLCRDYFNNIFDFALGEKEGIAKKPAPDMVKCCLDYFGLPKESAIYIGDSDIDYLTSVNSGLDQILVTWGFKDEDFLKTFNAMYYVNTPEEIARILQ